MRRIKFLLIFSFLLLSAVPALAQASKVITLRDGTQIRGEVTGMQNGVYTISSPTLGILDILGSDIETIASQDTPLPPALPTQYGPPAIIDGDNPLMQQAQQMQGKLMQDPHVMGRVQQIAQDPQMQAIMSDPSVMQDILSRDPERIKNNPKLQELLNNPDMRSLMDEVQTRIQGRSPE